MEKNDKHDLVGRYESRIKALGHGVEVLGEPKNRQWFYFNFITSHDEFLEDDSLLDVGCGYGDLYRFLKSNGYKGKYSGVDLVPGLIKEAQKLEPSVEFRVCDLQNEDVLERYDWASACGVFTGAEREVDFKEHLESMIFNMWSVVDKGLMFNLLSPLADYTHQLHTRLAFGDVIQIVNKFTNRFTFRHDYMPYEYSFALLKENQINEDLLIFEKHNHLFETIQLKKLNHG